MTMVLEKVNTVEAGQDYGEDIKPAKGAGEPHPKAKEKVGKEEKETKAKGSGKPDPKEKVENKGKEKRKSKHQKKGSGVDSSKKLNRQLLPDGCGFFGTIGCNRSIVVNF